MQQDMPSRGIGKLIAVATAAALLLTGCSPQFVMLHPAGPVGRTELHLILLSVVLIAIVVIPVILLLGFIVYRYRDKPDNTAPYQPDWADSKRLEIVWWSIPIVIVGILGTVTWQKTFALMNPPEANVSPITIDVTSLDWKWLFEYPAQNLATVNYVEIPAGVPVQFVITADAPMNSFWVPQLGGQEYTMPGMEMRLWLQADKPGTFIGRGANFTGTGFAHMVFNVVAVPEGQFNRWTNHVHQTATPLTVTGYQQLRQPSVIGTRFFSSYPQQLFNQTVTRDGGMQHMSDSQTQQAMTQMSSN